MRKFEESKLEKMNPNSRQYQEQWDRVFHGAMIEDKTIYRQVMDDRVKMDRQERKIVRAMQWRMQG